MGIKHTAEPWSVSPEFGVGRVIAKPNGKQCLLAQCQAVPHGDSQTNAARIVQCVNACAGIDNPAAALQQAREALWGWLDCAGPEQSDAFLAAYLAIGGKI